MYILIVFLFSPPSLLISIHPLFDMNTLTLYFHQPTISRRWGPPFTSSICTHLHEFSSRRANVARAIVSRDNTRRGSPPIDRWNDRYHLIRKNPLPKHSKTTPPRERPAHRLCTRMYTCIGVYVRGLHKRTTCVHTNLGHRNTTITSTAILL